MRKKKEKKEKSFAFKVVCIFMVIFTVAVCAVCYNQNQTLEDLKQEAVALESQIEEQKKEKLSLESKQTYYESDEYIEKVAREQLGLVKSGELVFVNNGQ